MKILYLFFLILALMISSAVAQEHEEAPKQDAAGQRGQRPRLMEALGLSPEQIKEIARLNRERRPQMQSAQQKLRESVRNLDMAIYSDSVSDSEFSSRLAEHQIAQAEVARLRFEGEFAMRKVLTPEQLVRFRDLRGQFNASRERIQKERRLRNGQHRFDRRRQGQRPPAPPED
jgi:Spy/CpxP family protein refolding chaperone